MTRLYKLITYTHQCELSKHRPTIILFVTICVLCCYTKSEGAVYATRHAYACRVRCQFFFLVSNETQPLDMRCIIVILDLSTSNKSVTNTYPFLLIYFIYQLSYFFIIFLFIFFLIFSPSLIFFFFNILPY